MIKKAFKKDGVRTFKYLNNVKENILYTDFCKNPNNRILM